MDIYNYDGVTGEFTGVSEADPDPLDLDQDGNTKYLIPANATILPVPAPMPNNARVFRNGKWGYVHVSMPDSVASNEPAQPTADDVAKERAVRLAGGFTYDFGDARGVHHINTSDADMKNWSEVTTLANALIMSGNPEGGIEIATDTGPVVISAMEWQKVLVMAGAFRQPVFAASFALQAMDPIPFDYKDDEYWPKSNVPIVNEFKPVDPSQNAVWVPPDPSAVAPPPRVDESKNFKWTPPDGSINDFEQRQAEAPQE